MPTTCASCNENAILKRPKTGDALCKECFYFAFEEEIHHTIVNADLLQRGETIAIGASGGKVNLVLLSVDEGITGYRDDSLETVKRNQVQYDLPLKIISYEALDRGALLLKVDKIATGHNADDIAETVIMNVLRGDIGRLRRCTAITTGTDGALPRCKPFKYTYEKEIVMYAYFKNLDYFSTECIYSPNAYRHHPLWRESVCEEGGPDAGVCERCGYISSNPVCKACVMLEGLNKGLPRLGIGKTHKERRKMNEMLSEQGDSSASSSLSDMSSLGESLSNKPCDRSGCACLNKSAQSVTVLQTDQSGNNIRDRAGQLRCCSGDNQSGCCRNSQPATGEKTVLEKLSIFNKAKKPVIDF
ncbi:CTU1-like protein [Mya arenaria]|uniref:CTU1-like protein n=1 Tax=Mya arenaria TaxID=6604 RepID=A0ABY7EVP0_MYAAR|nr:CTU1-like protein [Mya arenaria]